MKNLLPILLLVLATPGCSWMGRHWPWHHATSTSQPAPAHPKQNQSQIMVTPDDTLAAKVIKVNTVGRFVILSFPEGGMPKMQQHLFLYRGGMKTAEVKIVGPKQETSIVADIVSGEAQEGDTVRDQ